MIKLALLLIGGKAFRAHWWAPAVVGSVLILLAVVVIADLADGISVFATQLFGFVFLAQGVIGLVATASKDGTASMLASGLKALMLMGLGVLIFLAPTGNVTVLGWLFAAGFVVDGLTRLFLVGLVRFPRWREAVALSVVELLLAVLIISDWPLPAHLDIPLCIGLLLVGSGSILLHFAITLRNEPEEMAIYAFSLFGTRNWNENAPVLVGDDEPEEGPKPVLTVHVWTPTGAADIKTRRPIIDRYLMAFDVDGKPSTGHAALEVKGEVYVSHWPLDEIRASARDLAHVFYSGAKNDMQGMFLPSYEYECSDWTAADQHVEFTRYDLRRLKAYWAGYSQLNSYNVTNRNCSIAVAGGLESAFEGSLHCSYPWLRLLALLLTPALWQAAYIRSRAEHMCWTPGIVLDYARTLQRIIEPSHAGYPLKLLDRLHDYAVGKDVKEVTP